MTNPQPTANIILNNEMLKAFPLTSRTRQECPLLPLLLKIVLKSQPQQPDKKRKKASKLKGKRYLFADDLILFRENPKVSTQKLLKLINGFSKVSRYTFNIQKPIIFLDTNKKLSEREIKKTISFQNKSNRIKYLEINLTKEVKNLYSRKLLERKQKTIRRSGKIFCTL